MTAPLGPSHFAFGDKKGMLLRTCPSPHPSLKLKLHVPLRSEQQEERYGAILPSREAEGKSPPTHKRSGGPAGGRAGGGGVGGGEEKVKEGRARGARSGWRCPRTPLRCLVSTTWKNLVRMARAHGRWGVGLGEPPSPGRDAAPLSSLPRAAPR